MDLAFILMATRASLDGHILQRTSVGLFFVITAMYRFNRTFERYALIKADEKMHRPYLIKDELPHLKGRLRRFVQKRKVDSFGFLLGFFFIVISSLFHWNHLFLGTSISITVFSSILLTFDLFGQFRTEECIRQIEKHQKKIEEQAGN